MTAGRKNADTLSQHWCTPRKYVDAIRRFYHGTIALDPCSNKFSIVGADVEYTLPETDGLAASWNYQTIYVNPPYGADRERGTTIRNWLQKCAETRSRFDSEVIALVPVATNTRHWKLYVWGAATAIAFLYDTRLRFLVEGRDGGKGAPMSCAMVYWGPRHEEFETAFLRFGAVVDVRHLHDKPVGIGEQPSLFESSPSTEESQLTHDSTTSLNR